MVLKNAIACCMESIEKHKGKLTVKEQPKVVSVAIRHPLYILYLLLADMSLPVTPLFLFVYVFYNINLV